MHIQQIQLHNWKAYVDLTLNFPKPTKKRNVVLIGAMNGYGKTSLLEALVLGLFGRDGLGIVARAVMQDGESDRIARSYDDFLERALHANALKAKDRSASVEIAFKVDSEVVKIERIWHFTSAGKHRREDEEVRIFTGIDGEPLRIPRTEDREDFVRSFVAQTFLPVHLAQFFLFDGEQVQRLARRDMSTQVRAGIEGMLGVPVLRELARDLSLYAQARRNSVRGVGNETVERLRGEVREAEAALQRAEEELALLQSEIGPLRSRRDRLVKDLGSVQGGTYASLSELMGLKGKREREIDKHRDRLAQLLREDLALAIAGSELRHQVIERLRAEDELDRWENGKAQSAGGLAKLLNAVDANSIPVQPPLTDEQVAGIQNRLKEAWERIWDVPPAACADSYRHAYLGSSDRALVLARLGRVGNMGLRALRETLEQLDELERSIHKMDKQIQKQRGVDDGDKVKNIADELDALNRDLAEKESRARELNREIDGSRALLSPKKQELARVFEGYQRAQPALRRAIVADSVAGLIEDVVLECYPMHIEEVAQKMTKAFRAMSHKSLLSKIQIEPDCSVRLLGSGGRDMRAMDASAGENQIFALSLIAAINEVSKRDFPIVMDTPLARLDTEHRLRVLNYFTGKAGEQVILLSQPDEVHGRYLDTIRDRVGTSYKIEHIELGDGVGRSDVVPGYFERV